MTQTKIKNKKKIIMRRPGIEPGPHRWQRRILTPELTTQCIYIYYFNCIRALKNTTSMIWSSKCPPNSQSV